MSTYEVEVVYTVEADTWEEAESSAHNLVNIGFKMFDDWSIVGVEFGEIREV